MDGWMDGWMDRWMDGVIAWLKKKINFFLFIPLLIFTPFLADNSLEKSP